MSANPPIPPTEENKEARGDRIEASGGRIEVMLEWIRQDLNGVLQQQKLTNGRISKAENAIHDLCVDNEAAKKQHAIFTEGVEEWKVLKGQVSVIKNIGIFIVLLQVVAIILTRV